MLTLKQTMTTFPGVSLPCPGNVPVEVSLIAQLGVGAGNQLIQQSAMRQAGHQNYVAQLDEPSAKLAGVNPMMGDLTSLYSFVVGPQGHPFHRHAGHRVFTAISGSSGALLRFSSESYESIESDPQHFLDTLQHVHIPPDCLFTVRFGGLTWHQFLPLKMNSAHPTLFALSCHTNELGGKLDDRLQQEVLANTADIAKLTELLPPNAQEMLSRMSLREFKGTTYALSLDVAATSMRWTFCRPLRQLVGRARAGWQRLRGVTGFHANNEQERLVTPVSELPAESLLQNTLNRPWNYCDTHITPIGGEQQEGLDAPALLRLVLEGFLENPPSQVTRLMRLRNTLVRPLGLRRSELGCPVSSLLSDQPLQRFGCFPVLGQRMAADGKSAEVLLGADDKHLRFRSTVRVERHEVEGWQVSLSTAVAHRNWFGAFYMAVIHRVHHQYIAPTMLRMAVDHVEEKLSIASLNTTAADAARDACHVDVTAPTMMTHAVH